MNALELANILEKCVLDGSTNLVCVYDAVIMLRQLNTENEALKAEIDLLNLELGNPIDMDNYEKHQRVVTREGWDKLCGVGVEGNFHWDLNPNRNGFR